MLIDHDFVHFVMPTQIGRVYYVMDEVTPPGRTSFESPSSRWSRQFLIIYFFVNIYYGVRNCTDWTFHRYVHIFSRSHCSLIIVHRSLFIVHWVHWLFTCARRSIIFTKNNKRFRRVEERDLRGAGERKQKNIKSLQHFIMEFRRLRTSVKYRS